MTAPLLVFGFGNASRGDDALGPLAVQRLQALRGADARVAFLDDYQPLVEHALDLDGRERVLFVDASLSCAAPFVAEALVPAADRSVTSHALTPAALLQVYRRVQGREPPPATLLAIRGERFDLGAAPSDAALSNLHAALRWADAWLDGGAVTAPEESPRSTGSARPCRS